MQLQEIKARLHRQGTEMVELAKRLGEKGDKPEEWELDLIRQAMFGEVRERLEAAAAGYLFKGYVRVNLEDLEVR